MLFLGHLVIGLIAGFILYEMYHDQNAIIFCSLGSVLPDIIDKPLGHIILTSVLDNGKIYFHSLVIFILFFIAGILVWKYYRSPSFLYVALGVIIHQLVDLMWKRPVNRYYPFLGRYQVEVHQNYVAQVIITELSSPAEWIFFLAILMILLVAGIRIYQTKRAVSLDPLQEPRQHQLYAGLPGTALFVLILSIAIICLWHPYQAMIL